MLKSNKLAKKDFLSSLDMSTEEVNHTIELAKNLKNNDLSLNHDGKVLGLIFDKSSTRTRVSFQVAMSRLGGRSAEEVVFGKITTGASNDLQRATDIAEQMVGTFGMSDILGPLAYDKQGGGQFLGNGNNPRRSVSDATAQAIDKEVRDLVDDAHETALNILRNNLPLLESISQKILHEEVIEGEELKNLLAESKMPA